MLLSNSMSIYFRKLFKKINAFLRINMYVPSIMRIALSFFPSANRALAIAVVCLLITSSRLIALNPTWYLTNAFSRALSDALRWVETLLRCFTANNVAISSFDRPTLNLTSNIANLFLVPNLGVLRIAQLTLLCRSLNCDLSRPTKIKKSLSTHMIPNNHSS